jgi:hypothetical protein
MEMDYSKIGSRCLHQKQVLMVKLERDQNHRYRLGQVRLYDHQHHRHQHNQLMNLI